MEKTAVVAWGRANPPTIGHQKLFDKTIKHAKSVGGAPHIYVSHSQDSKKNPLSASEKVGLIKKAYKNHSNLSVRSSSKESPSILDIAKKLHGEGYHHLHVVAGSDRVEEYHNLLHKYNNKPDHYHFKSIKVVSAGRRDPDAEGASGMSGTKLRSHAIAGNKEEFKKGMMHGLSDSDKEDVYHKVRASLKEDYENPNRFDWGTPAGTKYMLNMMPKGEIKCPEGEYWCNTDGKCKPISMREEMNLREKYVMGYIYKLNEKVETVDGVEGEIVYRGSNYVTLQLEDKTTVKRWITDINEEKYRTQTGALKQRPSFKQFPDVNKKNAPKGVASPSEVKKHQDAAKEKIKSNPNDPSLLKQWPTDKGVKTKPSVYTKAYRERHGMKSEDVVPYLLMSPEQKQLFAEENNQLEYGGYKTKHFDASPEARAKFQELINKVGPYEAPPGPNEPVLAKVQAGIAMKPQNVRHMQFRQYTEL